MPLAIQSSPSAATQRQSPTARNRNSENLVTYCCVCFLPVTSANADTGGDLSANDPLFWLTSCGHIVCGSHVFPGGAPQDAARMTHICPYCSSSDISLADLSAGKVSQELRDYFRPESELLEDVAGAIKFRMSNVIRIASHYKGLAEKLQNKVDDQRRVLLKVKDELIEGKELKKQKPLMEAELTNLRQEISQLRSQLSSAQLSSLAYDDDSPQIQQQYRSSTETLQKNSISPVATISGDNNLHKRKTDIVDDPSFRAREFRNEMNKRQTMPPPMLPTSPQRMEQQYTSNIEEGQFHGKLQKQAGRIDESSAKGYSSQFQQLGYSPQPREDQLQNLYMGAAELQRFPIDYGKQFIDLTEPAITSMRPPPLPSPRGGFNHQQHHQGGNQSRNGRTNINIPFRSPLRAPTPRPLSPLPIRGTMNRYFESPSCQSARPGASYGDLISPSIQSGVAKFHTPVPRAEQMPHIQRQGSSADYLYDREGRPVTLDTLTVTNKRRNVVSPFFTDPPVMPINLGLPATEGGIRRPASMASFSAQQGGFNLSHGNELGSGGFFSRQDNSLAGGRLADAVNAPNWGTQRTRPGTVQRFVGSGGSHVFNPQRRSGIVDRPGLRRSVRRD